MALPKPSLVIFDMDGTTVRHLNPKILEILERLDDLSYKFFRLFQKLRPGQPQYVAKKRKKYSPKLLVHRTLHTMRRKPVEQIVEPCPDVVDVLDFLKEQAVPMALISNGLGRGYGHDILEKFDFEKYFNVTLFAEDLNRAKPDPYPILQALEIINPSPEQKEVIWYIGDRHKDILAAINSREHLDSIVVPVAYGYFGSACLAVLEHNLGTDHIIGSYTELKQVLQRLFSQ